VSIRQELKFNYAFMLQSSSVKRLEVNVLDALLPVSLNSKWPSGTFVGCRLILGVSGVQPALVDLGKDYFKCE
jgi:hypothetical protein